MRYQLRQGPSRGVRSAALDPVSCLGPQGLLTLALIEFRESWDALLWPILVTNKEAMRTVPVGLNVFRGEEVTVFNQLMAMSFLDMVPLLLMFLFFQRAFIQGVAPSGSKD